MPEAAQLGQMPNMGMGGYVPAPAQNTLSRQVLGALLTSLAGNAVGLATDKLTNPDYSKILNKEGITTPEPKWYQRNIGGDEATKMREAHNLATYRSGELGVAQQNAATQALAAKAQAAEADARTQRIMQMTPAELAQLEAERQNLGARTAQTQQETDIAKQMLPGSLALQGANLAATQAGTGRTIADTQRLQAMLGPEMQQVASQTGLNEAQRQRMGAETQLYNQQLEAGKFTYPGLTQYPQAMGQILMRTAADRGIDMNSAQGAALKHAHMTYLMMNPPEAGTNPAAWYAGYNRYIDTQLNNVQPSQSMGFFDMLANPAARAMAGH